MNIKIFTLKEIIDSSDLEKGKGQDVKTDLPLVVTINGDLQDIYTNSDNQAINIDINNGSRFCIFLLCCCVCMIFSIMREARVLLTSRQ